MEALKSLMRLAGDLAFTVLDGIDQMLTSSSGARAFEDDNSSGTGVSRELEPSPFLNPATGVRMRDGMGGVDEAGHLWGSRE